MTELDLTKLREIAEAATPGPWQARMTTFGDPNDGPTHSCVRVEGAHWTDHLAVAEGCAEADRNMAHIAAFDPPTVIALIDELERLRTIADAQVEAAAEVLTLDIDGSEWDEISPKAQDKVRELARQCLEAAREAGETTVPSEGIPF